MNPEHFISRLELAAQPEAVRWARRHGRDVLRAWHVPDDHVDTTTLVVSELVTNAVQHVVSTSPTAPPVRVALTLHHRRTHLIVEVADPDTRPPRKPGVVSPQSEGGRGLFIVESVAKEWGYCLPPTGGKVVWCLLPLE
ncbi:MULTISPECIES: ATP-binding protein [unclassified Streptomyces]|uniref:ATP-binding protein n=1 Tax=unclassified Streptomyces TaxID=2593676 RepID=UPI00381BA5B7